LKRHTDKERKEILNEFDRLRIEGVNHHEAAKKAGITIATVNSWRIRLGVKPTQVLRRDSLTIIEGRLLSYFLELDMRQKQRLISYLSKAKANGSFTPSLTTREIEIVQIFRSSTYTDRQRMKKILERSELTTWQLGVIPPRDVKLLKAYRNQKSDIRMRVRAIVFSRKDNTEYARSTQERSLLKEFRRLDRGQRKSMMEIIREELDR
jgi:hypothetical protein